MVAALIVCGLSIVRGFQGQTLMGRPLGGDFVQFYVAGKILNQYEPARMYDLDLEVRLQHEAVPEAPNDQMLVFASAPYAGLIYRLFARLPYPWAYVGWLAFSLALYSAAVVLLLRSVELSEPQRRTGFLLAISLNAVPHGELDRRADFRTRFLCGRAVCVLPRQESQVFRWSRACAGGVQADTHRDPGPDAVLRPALAHAGRGCNRGGRARAGFDSNGGNQRVHCVARHSEVLRASDNRSSGSAAPQQIRGCGFVFSFAAGECFDARASSGGCGGLGGARDPGDGVVAVKFMERGLA